MQPQFLQIKFYNHTTNFQMCQMQAKHETQFQNYFFQECQNLLNFALNIYYQQLQQSSVITTREKQSGLLCNNTTITTQILQFATSINHNLRLEKKNAIMKFASAITVRYFPNLVILYLHSTFYRSVTQLILGNFPNIYNSHKHQKSQFGNTKLQQTFLMTGYYKAHQSLQNQYTYNFNFFILVFWSQKIDAVFGEQLGLFEIFVGSGEYQVFQCSSFIIN
eukprot:TRINITY_DN13764_c0_g1_i6.p1 TRINITY_DN13764_c0_g1~~TRINITY_DN13764_c0_g1_i6.p1  ORF type:complete len:221 (+),score=-17.46 TRINITY_DN13764_c0_g1_i6:194-856(+)